MIRQLPVLRMTPDRTRLVLFLFAAFAFWLNANPYIGIDHDARLYAVMAYRWLNPQGFVRDPWFLFGSQDQYSVFSPLLAGYFSLLGVTQGAMVGTLLQGALFSIAVVVLARQGLGRVRYGATALLMVAFAVLYSPRGMLYVTEGFVTARGLAVPLSVLGITMSFRRRPMGAFVFHGLALVLHPLMALTPAAVSLLYPLGWRHRTVLWCCAVVAYVALLLGAARGVLPVISGDWLRHLELAPLIFIQDWLRDEFPRFLLWAAILFSAARWGAPRLRRMYALVPLVAGTAVVFSLLGSTVPWTLAMQVQFWRGLWLMKLLGLCAVADLATGFLRHAVAGRRRGIQVLAAVTFWASFSHPLWAAAIISLCGYRPFTSELNVRLRRHPRISLGITSFFLLLSLPEVMFAMTEWVKDMSVSGYWPEVLRGCWRTSALGTVALGVGVLLQRWRAMPTAALVAILFTFSAFNWDGRSDARIAQENCYSIDGSRSCLGLGIPVGATVYWQKQAERTWLDLATSSYIGGIHATGLVFSKERASLVQERLSRVVVAMTAEGKFPNSENTELIRAMAQKALTGKALVHPDVYSSYEDVGRLDVAGARWLCRDNDLDFVILSLPGQPLSYQSIACKQTRG